MLGRLGGAEVAAGFEQQDADRRLLGQSGCKHGSG